MVFEGIKDQTNHSNQSKVRICLYTRNSFPLVGPVAKCTFLRQQVAEHTSTAIDIAPYSWKRGRNLSQRRQNTLWYWATGRSQHQLYI